MSLHLSRVRGWVGAGLAEAAGRLVILSGSTAILARVLVPGDFGVSALILSIVTIFAVFVGTPYEEALAQRRVIRRIHLDSAMAASLAAAIALILLSVPIGWTMDRLYADHRFVLMLPVAASSLVAQGPLTIATAVARRRRKFYAINVAGLVGHAAGAGFAVALGLSGAGLWALIGLRVGIVWATAMTLMVLLRLALVPRWSWPTITDLNGFALFVLMTRLVENLIFLVYNVTVGSLFGITVLGYANMAMRLIEPIRGAMIGITHNLCFSFFLTVTRDRARVGQEARRISAESSVLIAPVFMGLAAVSPILVPLLAGPGWGEAVPIAVMLALGAMVALPSVVVLSALSVVGRPKQAVYANGAGLAAMVLVLAATSGMDPVAAGAARAVNDLVQTLFTVLVSGPLIMLPRKTLLQQIAGSWAAAGAMALVVAAIAGRLGAVMPLAAALPLAVASGVAVYVMILLVFARPVFDRLWSNLLRRHPPSVVRQAAE